MVCLVLIIPEGKRGRRCRRRALPVIFLLIIWIGWELLLRAWRSARHQITSRVHGGGAPGTLPLNNIAPVTRE